MNFQVCDETEHLIDDDADTAEMCLTENKEIRDSGDRDISDLSNILGGTEILSKSATVASVTGT